jgi:hypothetical protein
VGPCETGRIWSQDHQGDDVTFYRLKSDPAEALEDQNRRGHLTARRCDRSGIGCLWSHARAQASRKCPIEASLVRAHRAITVWRLAHNGLVGGSNSPSPTTQSGGCGEFLAVFAKAPNGRASCSTAWSLRPLIRVRAAYWRFFLRPPNPVSRQRRHHRKAHKTRGFFRFRVRR